MSKEEDRRKKYDLTLMHLQQLASRFIENEKTDEEFVKYVMYNIKYPIVKLPGSDIEYTIVDYGITCLYSRQELANGCKDKWVEVMDLTELTVIEYNELVKILNEKYPDYDIKQLTGRFV